MSVLVGTDSRQRRVTSATALTFESAESPAVRTGQIGAAAIKPEPDGPTTHDASTSNFSHDPERRLPY
jgi:hypothetical protein